MEPGAYLDESSGSGNQGGLVSAAAHTTGVGSAQGANRVSAGCIGGQHSTSVSEDGARAAAEASGAEAAWEAAEVELGIQHGGWKSLGFAASSRDQEQTGMNQTPTAREAQVAATDSAAAAAAQISGNARGSCRSEACTEAAEGAQQASVGSSIIHAAPALTLAAVAVAAVTTFLPGKRRKAKRVECVVCLDAKAQVMLLPCKHSILCWGCSQLLEAAGKPCPICCAPVEQHVGVAAAATTAANAAVTAIALPAAGTAHAASSAGNDAGLLASYGSSSSSSIGSAAVRVEDPGNSSSIGSAGGKVNNNSSSSSAAVKVIDNGSSSRSESGVIKLDNDWSSGISRGMGAAKGSNCCSSSSIGGGGGSGAVAMNNSSSTSSVGSAAVKVNDNCSSSSISGSDLVKVNNSSSSSSASGAFTVNSSSLRSTGIGSSAEGKKSGAGGPCSSDKSGVQGVPAPVVGDVLTASALDEGMNSNSFEAVGCRDGGSGEALKPSYGLQPCGPGLLQPPPPLTCGLDSLAASIACSVGGGAAWMGGGDTEQLELEGVERILGSAAWDHNIVHSNEQAGASASSFYRRQQEQQQGQWEKEREQQQLDCEEFVREAAGVLKEAQGEFMGVVNKAMGRLRQLCIKHGVSPSDVLP